MSQFKPHDILWPLNERAVENIDANFNAIWTRLTELVSLMETPVAHDLFSEAHADTEPSPVVITFGANDSAGAGYRTVTLVVPNV